MSLRSTLAVIICLSLCWQAAYAAETRTEHTFKLSPGESPPDASVSEVAWLTGAWSCKAFGKTCEEYWSAPSAGSMVGSFKLLDDSGVQFYELMLITRVDDVLTLRVKHFNEDMSAWEERAETVDFPLVAISNDAVHFSGLSFYRRSPGRIDGYIVMSEEDGVREYHLQYQRLSWPGFD